MRQAAILLLKTLASLTLCYFLVSRVGFDTVVRTLLSVQPASFIIAVVLYLLAMYVSARRWRILIPLEVRTTRLYALYAIGSFFNIFLPGIIGGDAVKAFYLSRDLKALGEEGSGVASRQPQVLVHENALALASVFMDRYVGFAALLAINLLAFFIGFRYVEGTALTWVIPSVAALFVAASVCVFTLKVGTRFNFARGVYDYFALYRRRRDILMTTFAYSVVVQLLGIVAVFALARGMSLDVSFVSLLVFVPIAILISLIPLSISGLGFREGAFVILLGTVGIPSQSSMTVSLLWFLSMVVASLWGLVEYLRVKKSLGGVTITEKGARESVSGHDMSDS